MRNLQLEIEATGEIFDFATEQEAQAAMDLAIASPVHNTDRIRIYDFETRSVISFYAGEVK